MTDFFAMGSGVPLRGVAVPMLLRDFRWEAGVAYGGGRRFKAASQSKGKEEENGEPDILGFIFGVNGLCANGGGMKSVVKDTRCHGSHNLSRRVWRCREDKKKDFSFSLSSPSIIIRALGGVSEVPVLI